MPERGAFRHRAVRRLLYVAAAATVALLAAYGLILAVEPQLSYTPRLSETLTPEAGDSGFPAERDEPIPVTPELLRLGRETFYEESFGSEVFLTEVLGVLDGPLNVKTLGRAILGLRGRGTHNLRVTIDRDIRIGDRLFKNGEVVDTGLDVPSGRLLPLGVTVHLTRQGIQMGIACAACHAVVDPASRKVIEGPPNADLDTGLILALAPNSSAFFKHTGVRPDDPAFAPDKPGNEANNEGDGEQGAWLPDADAFERAVDADLLRWPPGNFDSTWDLVNNPSQIPDTYTWLDDPYGWSGAFAAGPFDGLFAFTSNVHSGNSDMFTVMAASSRLLGLERGVDEELYIGTLLQNAADPAFRLPDDETRPSRFFRRIDPTPGVAGMNELIPLPGFPRGSPVSPDGLLASSPGLPAGRQVAAMAAWQHTLQPPPPAEAAPEGWPRASRPEGEGPSPAPVAGSSAPAERLGPVGGEDPATGRGIFAEAGCARCHDGVGGSGRTVVSAAVVGTEPSRAKAMRRLPNNFGEGAPRLWAFETPVPLPAGAESIEADRTKLIDDPRLASWPYARDEEVGAYKVPGLIGLGVSAPYLHDGGVAVAPDAVAFDPASGWQILDPGGFGMPGTVKQARLPDPGASLLALIDRELRARGVAANRTDPALARTHVTGAGHPYWVDRAGGFTPQDQSALIRYLLAWRYPSGD